MRKTLPLLLLSALTLLSCGRHESPQTSTGARSVILLIGDGVDDHQLTLGRNYLHGAAGALLFEEFTHRATARVLTVFEDDANLPNYVGDSASGGTALATGVVTSMGRIATTAQTDEDIVTIVELAKSAGKKVGVVATSSITDATPASFYSHVSVRFCEGPDDMDDEDSRSSGESKSLCPADSAIHGGPGSIAAQLSESQLDVALGGGLDSFMQFDDDGVLLLDRVRDAGFEIVQTAEELATTDADRVLWLFTLGHLPVIWQGEGGARAVPFSEPSSGAPAWPPTFGCEPNPEFEQTPTLATLTQRAIDLLSTGDDGFFLMVESASIDKQSHFGNPCGQIGEIQQLEEAVQVALDFAQEHPDTLILVASDHGHAAQVIPYPSLFDSMARERGDIARSPGKMAVVETPEGSTMGVNYATSTFFYEEHTWTAVPIFGQGPGAERVTGMIDQTDVFEIIKTAMGI